MSAFLRIRPFALAILGFWFWLTGPLANAADIDFYRDVYPVLKSNCIACHNKTTTKAALNMETPETMRKGGDSGEGLIPGQSVKSLVFQAAAHVGDVAMPPKGNKSGAMKLTSSELALLKTWIDEGARSSVKLAREVAWQPLPPGINPIYSVALTRDGRLAACGRANQVFVYDLATRRLVTRLVDESLKAVTGPAHKALVQSLAFSPDGLRLASGSFREVKIWRRQPGLVTTRKGDLALGASLSAFSADGKQVVMADSQGALLVVDALSGKTLKTISPGQKGGLKLLCLSPNGVHAATYGTEGTLSLWNLQNGQRIAVKQGVPGLRTLTWTHDGNAIATGGDDKVIRLWPLPAGEKAELVVGKEFKGATGSITAIEAGPDALLAASADGKVQVWKLAEAKPSRELSIPGMVALGLSGNGKLLAAGRSDGAVQVWDLATGKPVIELIGDVETTARLAELDWTVAAEGLEMAFQRQEAARFEALNKGLDELLKKANDNIASIRKDLVDKQNALKQATGAKDAALAAIQAREIHLKDAEVEALNYAAAQTRNKTAIAAANAAIAKAKATLDKATADAAATRIAAAARKLQPLAVRFSADDQTVAAALSDGSMRAWAVASGLPIQQTPGSGLTRSASLVAGGEGSFLACATDGSTTRVSTASTWILERTLGGDTAASPFVDRVNALRFSPDGKTLAAGGGEPTRSGDISLWDVTSGKLVHEWKERHTDAVLSLDFSPDGKQIASGGADKIARVTDIATGKVMNMFEGHTHHVMGVSFRADGRALATAGGDGVVVVWDMISGERKKKIEGWTKEVTSLQFIGATNQILTSAGDNLIRIVDDNGGQVRALAKLPDFMQSAASTATASLIIGGGEDGVLRVWTGTTGQELATFGAESNARTP